MRHFRVIDSPWDLSYQYEMLKFPFVEWTWLANFRQPSDMTDRGNISSYFKWATHYEPGKYDLAVLHLDDECANPREIPAGRGKLYHDLNSAIQDIPKIVIVHHTPGCLGPSPQSGNSVEFLRSIVGDNYMVVHSRQAAEQWGWGRPIIHGLDSREWWNLYKEPRVITILPRSGLDHCYDRAFLHAVRLHLKMRDITLCQVYTDYKPVSWDDYREFLGKSLIYLSPTREVPMPRARTEAMLSGCCVLSTANHDADTFITSGSNGFLVERDSRMVADVIEELITDPQRARQIGESGRLTAEIVFGWERFATDWRLFFECVVADFKCRLKAGAHP